MSLGDDWVIGVIKSVARDDSRNHYYEFKYEDGPTVYIMAQDIAGIEKVEPVNEKSKPKLIHLKSVK